MLTLNDQSAAAPGAVRNRLARMRSIKWLGQTTASVCWIGSLMTSGIGSTGDWLQLSAASAWLLANIATIVTADTD